MKSSPLSVSWMAFDLGIYQYKQVTYCLLRLSHVNVTLRREGNTALGYMKWPEAEIRIFICFDWTALCLLMMNVVEENDYE